MLISGDVLPIGKLNSNGWGIPDSKEEIDSIVSTLVDKAIPICPRNEPHGCDYDPKSEIGRVKHAWFDPLTKKIRAIGEILDPVAIEKIKSGVWKKNWSVRVAVSEKDKDGWIRKPVAQNLTIVPKGAWGDANWDVLASSDSGLEFKTLDEYALVDDSVAADGANVRAQMTIDEESFSNDIDEFVKISYKANIASKPNVLINWNNTSVSLDENMTPNQEVGNMVDEKTTVDAKNDDVLAAKDAEITALKTQMAEMTASFESKAKEFAAQAVAAAKAEAAREVAIKEYIATATERGIKDIDTKVFDNLDAEKIGVFTAALKAIKVETKDETAGKGVTYPSSREITPEENGGLSVGIPMRDESGNLSFVTKV